MTDPGWYSSPDGADHLRWWDGRQWTGNTSPLPERNPSVAGTAPESRGVAALAHFGVPLLGPFAPLTIWWSSPPGSFARAHATQAFSFQAVFFGAWVVLVGCMAAGIVEPTTLLIVLGSVIVLELPQVALALAGRPPLKLVPFRLLRE